MDERHRWADQDREIIRQQAIRKHDLAIPNAQKASVALEEGNFSVLSKHTDYLGVDCLGSIVLIGFMDKRSVLQAMGSSGGRLAGTCAKCGRQAQVNTRMQVTLK